MTKLTKMGFVFAGIILLFVGLLVAIVRYQSNPKVEPVAEPNPVSSSQKRDEESRIRSKTWKQISNRLDQADRTQLANLPRRVDGALNRLNTFFDGKRPQIKSFAEQVIGWKEIWGLAKAQISDAARNEHHAQIREQFENLIFRSDELRSIAEEIVQSFIGELELDERNLLNEVRLELIQTGQVSLFQMGELTNSEQFHVTYWTAVPQAVKRINFRTAQSVDAILLDRVTRIIAEQIVMKVARGISIRAGVKAVGLVPFGVGFVANIVLSLALDAILGSATTDPVSAISANIEESLNQTIRSLKEGELSSKDDYSRLMEMARTDPEPDVRENARTAAQVIANNGFLGLRHELFQLAEQRQLIRREVLRHFIEGEETP